MHLTGRGGRRREGEETAASAAAPNVPPRTALPSNEERLARARKFELNTLYEPPPGDPLEHNTSGDAKTMCPQGTRLADGRHPGAEARRMPRSRNPERAGDGSQTLIVATRLRRAG
ncbi:MAG TPA: hypothetical protein VKE51_39820 [Vicinamibacterales bacterium]|nr:hypothetical protein [Vicinamibacterales bacterium]